MQSVIAPRNDYATGGGNEKFHIREGLIDTAGLVPFAFLGVTLDANLNLMVWDWTKLIFWAVEIVYTAFLLRPSKCKQICESLCFAEKEPEVATRE